MEASEYSTAIFRGVDMLVRVGEAGMLLSVYMWIISSQNTMYSNTVR